MKTYEVIETSNVVNLDNETVKTLNAGETVTGEFVLIDEQPYVEISDGYVSTKGLAEKISEQEVSEEVETKVKASNKKLIFALVGAGVGFAVAQYVMKTSSVKKKVIFTVGGVALGLLAEYVNQKRK
jgi:hypothetical protein